MKVTATTMTAASLALALAGAPAVLAQSRPDGTRSARDSVTKRFMKAAPDIGERIPNLKVYDAAGEKRKLRDLLDGHYTVLVFGCLT